MVGEWLVASGIKIDSVYSSPHKRTLMSAKHMLGKYPTKVPVHVMQQIHSKGKSSPGISFKEIREIIPDIAISEDC